MRNPTLICICLHLIFCPGHGEIGPHGAFLISFIFRGVDKDTALIVIPRVSYILSILANLRDVNFYLMEMYFKILVKIS